MPCDVELMAAIITAVDGDRTLAFPVMKTAVRFNQSIFSHRLAQVYAFSTAALYHYLSENTCNNE